MDQEPCNCKSPYFYAPHTTGGTCRFCLKNPVELVNKTTSKVKSS